jgi:hypothetical protein
VIGLPMTTAGYNETNPFALRIDGPGKKGSYVLVHQPKSFDWRARGTKPHPLRQAPEGVFTRACRTLTISSKSVADCSAFGPVSEANLVERASSGRAACHKPTYPANLCPFLFGGELSKSGGDFGESVDQSVENRQGVAGVRQ